MSKSQRGAARKLDQWAGKPNPIGERHGGLCCTSTWVDDLVAAKDPTYYPTTPCDSKACRKRGTRYPEYYVKARRWRLAPGEKPTELGCWCDDCWLAWLKQHIDPEVLEVTEGRSASLLRFKDGIFTPFFG